MLFVVRADMTSIESTAELPSTIKKLNRYADWLASSTPAVVMCCSELTSRYSKSGQVLVKNFNPLSCNPHDTARMTWTCDTVHKESVSY